ncbi:MAG: methyltransferase [Planctomycetes bacterium]|nr:methyltransferase [Planctomycetota bacterium]
MTDPHNTPQARLMQALFGVMVTKCISAVASMDVADALKDGPLYYTDLAAVVGADQRALHRVMRMLVSVGIFDEPTPGSFGLNELSDLLRSDVHGSLRDMAVMITSESHWVPWGELENILRTGDSGPQHAFGKDLFSWFQDQSNREQWEIFNAAMTSFSGAVAKAAVEAYDFSRFNRIIDVGGGHGYFLRSLLNEAPEANGVLFDLPGVIESAIKFDRMEPVDGDFFLYVPDGGDCYTLKNILHDWDDEKCVQLLKNIANAMKPSARVLVIESVMPDSAEPHPAKFMDVNMLAMTEGGCERTLNEYSVLLDKAGLRLKEVYPTPGAVSIIEAGRN